MRLAFQLCLLFAVLVRGQQQLTSNVPVTISQPTGVTLGNTRTPCEFGEYRDHEYTEPFYLTTMENSVIYFTTCGSSTPTLVDIVGIDGASLVCLETGITDPDCIGYSIANTFPVGYFLIVVLFNQDLESPAFSPKTIRLIECPAGQEISRESKTGCTAPIPPQCSPTCASESCIGSTADECTTCDSPRYLNIKNEQAGSCDYFCQRGFYEDGILRRCTACNSQCESCFGGLASECFTCNSGAFLQSPSTCDIASMCPGGTFPSEIGRVCAPCPHACATCDADGCMTCDGDRFLLDGQCVINCPPKTWEDSSAAQPVCSNCDETCAECNGAGPNACVRCPSDKGLVNGACVDSCPAGTFQASGLCLPCNSRCRNGCNGPARDDCFTA